MLFMMMMMMMMMYYQIHHVCKDKYNKFKNYVSMINNINIDDDGSNINDDNNVDGTDYDVIIVMNG